MISIIYSAKWGCHGTSERADRHGNSACVSDHRDHSTCRAKSSCFALSIFAGLRVGEIAALTVGDVATQNGDVRREIKLGAHQTKGIEGQNGYTIRTGSERDRFIPQESPKRDQNAPLIASQRNGRPFTNVTLSMLFKEIYETAGIRTSSHSGRRTFATRLNEKGVGMRTIQKLMGHRNIGTTALYCEVSDDDDEKCGRVGLKFC